jgi:hypothetical protein
MGARELAADGQGVAQEAGIERGRLSGSREAIARYVRLGSTVCR